MRVTPHHAAKRVLHSLGHWRLHRQIMTSSVYPSKVVVCIHGFGGYRLQMVPMATALKRAGFTVYNYAYPARRYTLEEHGNHLAEFLESVAQSPVLHGERAAGESGCEDQMTASRSISFVTHSFGGVLLRETLRGACHNAVYHVPIEALNGRAVCIGPPFAGTSLARALRYRQLSTTGEGRMPFRMVERLARAVLGPGAGRQLLEMPSEWFTARGGMPHGMPVLVIAGDIGKVNPFVVSPVNDTTTGTPSTVVCRSDGVVGVHETWLPSRHCRMLVRAPHNMLLYTPATLDAAVAFLLGRANGDWDPAEEKNNAGALTLETIACHLLM